MTRLWRIAVLLAALIGAGQASAAEVIHSFVSDVKVAKDGELTVTETLQVRAEGNQMRHGIYRDFPLTFKDAAGTLREVTFSLLGVSRDGNAEPYHTERTHGIIRIYAGDKDVLISPGEHTYVFVYVPAGKSAGLTANPSSTGTSPGTSGFSQLRRRHIACSLPAAAPRCAGPHSPEGSERAASIGKGASASLARSRSQPRGGCRPAQVSPWSPSWPPASSSRRERTPSCGTKSWITANGSSAASAFSSCSSTTLWPGARSAATPSAAPSSRCSIRRRAFRRRSPTTSTFGGSRARNGAPSPRRRCRSR